MRTGNLQRGKTFQEFMNFLLEEDELAFELVFVQTFPCNRSDCRFCSFVNSRDTIEAATIGRQIKKFGHFTYITNNLSYLLFLLP